MFEVNILKRPHSNSYTYVMAKDKYFYKCPTSKGIAILKAWLINPDKVKTYYSPQREPNRHEKETKLALPEFITCRQADLLYSLEETTYWLNVFELHYHELKKTFNKNIPDCEFGFGMVGMFTKRIAPTLKQEYIEGLPLSEMIFLNSLKCGIIKPQYQKYSSSLLAQLKKFITSAELDFNIENFVFSEKSKTLFYIDNEPAFLVPAEVNDNNRNSIIKYIIDGNLKAG